MPEFIVFIYFALLFGIQTSLLELVSISGVVPDLALIAAVYCVMAFSGDRGLVAGCSLGFIQDCLSGSLLGVNTLSKSLIAYFFATLKDKIMVEGIVPVFFFVMVASFFDGMVFYGTTWMLFQNEPPPEFFLGKLPLYALYNAAIAPMLFYLLDRNKRWWCRRLQLTAS